MHVQNQKDALNPDEGPDSGPFWYKRQMPLGKIEGLGGCLGLQEESGHPADGLESEEMKSTCTAVRIGKGTGDCKE